MTKTKTQPHPHSLKIPFPLTEKFLFRQGQGFQKDGDLVRLVTYDGFRDVHIKNVLDYSIRLADGSSVAKINVLMVFPKASMQRLKAYIKRREPIAKQGLNAIVSKKERPKVDVVAIPDDVVDVVLRNGLVMRGIVVWNSRYNTILRLGGTKAEGGKIVLIYNHGVYAFEKIASEASSDAV